MMIDNQMTRRKDIGNILTSDFHKYYSTKNFENLLYINKQKQKQCSERWSIPTGLRV